MDWRGATIDHTGSKCDSGSGDFQQPIKFKDTVKVGEIPIGKAAVKIYLSSDKDVDVQLHDKESGVKIIAYPNGLLNGATAVCVTHESLEYCYSGYFGENKKKGHEYITVSGAQRIAPLSVMYAYGWAAGDVLVDYGWGEETDCGKACCNAVTAPFFYAAPKGGKTTQGWADGGESWRTLNLSSAIQPF